MTTIISTPWGIADSIKVFHDDIIFVTTPSHGGYRVTGDLLDHLTNLHRNWEPWAGRGWYEEDADAAIVAVAFPWYHPPRTVLAAISQVQRSHGYYPKKVKELAEIISEATTFYL